jgi:glycosyltransferase involved in cell wall biosynthesis
MQVARTTGAEIFVSNTMTVPTGALAARALRIPHAWFLHEFGHQDHLRFLLGRRLTFAAIDRLSDVVIVNSPALKEFVGARMPRRIVRVAPYAVTVPPDIVAMNQDGAFRAVVVGFKSPGKGQIDAIKAVALMARRGFDVQLELIGDSAPGYEEELRSLCGTLDVVDRVRLSPFRVDRFAAMLKASVVVVCSRMESLGRVTVEAMKLGRPVIGARAGATTELVKHGWNGLLYDPGDAEQLAACLEKLWRSRGLGTQMGDRGRKSVADVFNSESYGSALEGAFAVAGQKHRAA